MYENRITFFIDILGFRNIVENTETNNDYAKEIFEVLNSMKSEHVSNEMFIEINETEESKKEMKSLKEIQAEISKAFIKESSIRITHFSDSIVLSIGLENDMYAMSLIEYVGRLIYRLWRDFKILIRGGVSVDKLVHIENGPLFGPAMVKAYDLEANLANYPRIILDDNCFLIIANSPSYHNMKNLFKPFSEKKEEKGKTIKIDCGFEMNLATSFNHLVNNPFFHIEKRKEILNEIRQSSDYLKSMSININSVKVKEKYEYLIRQIENTEYPRF